MKKKILMIDDDVDLCNALKVAVEHAGYDMLTAASRVEGMEKITSEWPDLIILDVMIETWQDGFEMSRDLKSDPRFKNMPILMLTSVEEKTGIDIKSSAGDPVWLPVDGFLDKPVAPDVLLAEIRRLLQSPQPESLPR
jgi:two-component system alkaline phosphatase synthesis response regulator PhoP